MARLNPFPTGYVVASGVPLFAAPMPCNKISIQVLPTANTAGAPTNAATDLVFVGRQGMNKVTGVGVYGVVPPGGGLVIGDEFEDDVFDANRDFYVDSSSGTAAVTGFAYQR